MEERAANMNVSLTRELERLIERKVKSGMYQTASEVVREGLRLIKERDERARLRSNVQAGFEAIERHEYDNFDSASTKALAERVKAQGRDRLSKSSRKIS
jgi:antitoxin ParD1/3/4